jgi:hypothetical protein
VSRTELPPPLPPETRTVGQLVAESVRLYGARFWASVALGFGPAAVALMLRELPDVFRWTLIPVLGAAIWALAYIGACRVGLAVGVDRRNIGTAFAVGMVAFLPLILQRVLVLPGFDVVTLAYFALVGLAVPVALVEGRGFRDSLRRGLQLGRADFVHAFGSLATLVITTFLTGLVLFFLLRGVGDQAVRVAAFLALLVLAPLFLLGAALLYVDQAARVVDSSPRPRRSDADLHPALEPDGAGRPDPEGESRPAPRGKQRRRGAGREGRPPVGDPR